MTDAEIRDLISHFQKDLEAFAAAEKILLDRSLELESDPEMYKNFVSWSGTQIVFHGLIMCQAKVRGIIDDLRSNLQSEAPVVRLVEETDAESES